MKHTLTIELPKEIYDQLLKIAQQKGRTPEDIAVEYLKQAVSEEAGDPTEKFIGAFHSDISHWVDKQDKYLKQTQIDEMNKKTGKYH